VKDAWYPSQLGLGWVERQVVRPKHLIVIGDSAADFALALGWDRMCGAWTSMWMPIGEQADEQLVELLGGAMSNVWLQGRMHDEQMIVTSSVHSQETVEGLVRAALAAVRSWVVVEGYEENDEPVISYVPYDQIDFTAVRHLACVPDDYDIRLTLASRTSRDGALELLTRIPAHLPTSDALRELGEPFWEVDVGVRPSTIPAGRGLPRSALVSGVSEWTRVRASRQGISFHSYNQGWNPGGYTLRQRVAQPRLRYPGLQEWVRLVAGSDVTVAPSDAGYRADVCARVWGGRRQLMSDIGRMRPMLRAFRTTTTSTSEAFPDGDGVCIRGYEAVLMFRAARRLLPSTMTDADVRDSLDRLLTHGALRRGLVLGCASCSSKFFVGVGDLAQVNRCPRCYDEAQLTQARWKKPEDEPSWFYDLHGTLRDLLDQNGDVPLLGAAHFAAKAQSYNDLVETLLQIGSDRTELDLIAVADSKLIVAEAKKQATRRMQRSQLTKLVAAAVRLRADVVALLAGEGSPWSEADIDHVHGEIAHHEWTDGRRPELVTVTNLYTSPRQLTHARS
jgi:hypothetical protein